MKTLSGAVRTAQHEWVAGLDDEHLDAAVWDLLGVPVPGCSVDTGRAWEAIDRLITVPAFVVRVNVMNRAVGPWACSIILRVGEDTPDVREFSSFEYAATRARAMAMALAALLHELRNAGVTR